MIQFKFLNIQKFLLLVLVSFLSISTAQADIRSDEKIKALEDHVNILIEEIASLKESKMVSENSSNGLTLGGYGEIHYNDSISSDKDAWDIHRFVIYAGYSFNNWISLHSETEIEHAYIQNSKGNGEVAIEQLYIDFMLKDAINIRAGRILIPVGIVNPYHEPTLFNGVERPNLNKVIIPSTWYGDGGGIFGKLSPSLKYELYFLSGLDGSGLNGMDGIRGGRMKERPGFNEPAITGRLDYSPFADTNSTSGDLRLGCSFYIGGLDNSNKGSTNGISSSLSLYSADFQYKKNLFELRGEFATIQISNPQEIADDVAETIQGYYIEAALNILPESFKNGLLSQSDLKAFVRYEDYNTQHKMPLGIQSNPEASRQDITFGISFFPTHSIVIKADYQIKENDSNNPVNNSLNLGIGWRF